jgi:hypothetical protein
VVGQLAADAYADGGRCVPCIGTTMTKRPSTSSKVATASNGATSSSSSSLDFVHVPRPTPHAFEVLEPSRALSVVTSERSLSRDDQRSQRRSSLPGDSPGSALFLIAEQ